MSVVTVQETTHVRAEAEPWIPFKPLCDEVLIRYHWIDQTQGHIVADIRVPPGGGLAPLYHTGPVLVHTIRGAWRYREQPWISRTGDTVHEAAGSTHTAQSLSDQETHLFVVVAGEFLFFNEEGTLVWQENWRTSRERRAEHCRNHGIDLSASASQY